MDDVSLQSVTPSVQNPVPRASGRIRASTLLPWIVLAVMLPASFWLFAFTRDSVESVAQTRFDRQASDVRYIIEARVRSYADVMLGLRALLATQNPVTRVQFHRYVESLNLRQHYPGYDVVNYATHVSHNEKQRLEQAVRFDTSLRPEGYPNFAIRPPGERSEYFVIVYVEPMEGFEFALGLDLAANSAVDGSDPKSLTALQHAARDSGALTASGRPIRIKSRGKEYIGLAVRLAVYLGGMPLNTVLERRAAYQGSVGAGFNVEELMKGVLNAETSRNLHFAMYDVGSTEDAKGATHSAAKEWLLFDSAPESKRAAAQKAAGESADYFFSALPLEFGGRLWQIHFSARKDQVIDGIDTALPWIVLVGGIFSSILLTGVLYSLASSRGRAVALAENMTKNLRASAEQLQALSRRLVEIQESERRELSRELHDRVGQNLTALSITLDILKSQPGSQKEAQARLDDAAALLESTTGAIENVMSELRPPMLDDYGLLSALQWYANAFTSRTGIKVRVRGEEALGRQSPASEIALFRIAQEALNNIAKHAQASGADISLARSNAHLVMSVTDDGVGLDHRPGATPRRRSGLGMVTMRERTQAVGGVFEIGPAPVRGTQVTVRVPS